MIVFLPEPKSDIDKKYKYRNLDQRADHSGKSLSAVQSENADAYRYGKFEIVTCGRERNRGIFIV